MKKNYFFILMSLIANFTIAQSNSFKLEEKFTTIERAKKISDSLKLPVLITDTYVFSIGDSCYKRMLEGYINNRDADGDLNNRDKDGANNERNKGGAVAERTKKSKKNKRNKDGDSNDRDEDGDVNDRNKDGNNNNRNADGSVNQEPYCSNTKKGKILLYTIRDINVKKATIYFENQTFNNNYFKINKL